MKIREITSLDLNGLKEIIANNEWCDLAEGNEIAILYNVVEYSMYSINLLYDVAFYIYNHTTKVKIDIQCMCLSNEKEAVEYIMTVIRNNAMFTAVCIDED